MPEQKLISDDQLWDIKNKAQKATEGPWVCYAGTPYEDIHAKSIFVEITHDHFTHSYEIAHAAFAGTVDDAIYIAAVNPEVVIPMIDELRKLRARDKFLIEILQDMCVQMPCDDCPLANDVDGCEVKLAGGMDKWIEGKTQCQNK